MFYTNWMFSVQLYGLRSNEEAVTEQRT